MDLRLDDDQRRFRQEIADFCDTELAGRKRSPQLAAEFTGKVAEKGWLGLNIPVRYGGLGKSPVHRVIFNEEMAYRRAPISLGMYGRSFMLFGQTCLRHGSEAMKRKWLPKLAAGEAIGQCYTEPEAGTDVTRIQTRAVRKGDHYAVTGQKMFITTAHVLKHTLLMAVTDPGAPPENGLSMMLMENRSPGMSLTPLTAMGGYRTNQLFLDDVRVPVENLVGEENMGYHYYVENKPFYLHKEQGAIPGEMQYFFESLVSHCKSTTRAGRYLASDPVVRQKLSDTQSRIRASRHLAYKMAWMEEQGLELERIALETRIFDVEAWLAFNDLAMTVLGRPGQLSMGEERAPLGGVLQWKYQYDALQYSTRGSPSYTKTLLATHALGMPEH